MIYLDFAIQNIYCILTRLFVIPFNSLNSMEARVCLECGSKVRGRTDKKFCNDQCRNAYHNRMKNDKAFAVKKINHILRHNRQILHRLIPEEKGKTTLHRDKLISEGFNFNYHTHIYTTKNGHGYIFCYEYREIAFKVSELIPYSCHQ